MKRLAKIAQYFRRGDDDEPIEKIGMRMAIECFRNLVDKPEWKWSYSRWTGVMYGPIPVGIIVVGIVAIIYYSSK